MPTSHPRTRRLLLVDDHAVVRAGYRRLLEQAEEAWDIHEAENGESAYRRCAFEEFCAVVLDLSLPGISGLETLRRLRRRNPEQRVLIMSMHDQPAFVEQTLKAGAMGYITKSSAPEILLEAVREVVGGRRYLGPDVASCRRSACNDEDSAFDRLSPREFEIFRMLASGERVSTIADRLCISYKTAANYSTAVRGKLSVGSPSDLTRMAIRAGLLEA
ncbi:MAG: response regulator transcription factor [Ectothiorhodospiraceae bacterium]|nr:response regulator transcription factor [Ectothiorhodospiraceae bacterium]MCH8503464.1 response regulator transcription factor [Ectothiorhodospiraceae bacterium]